MTLVCFATIGKASWSVKYGYSYEILNMYLQHCTSSGTTISWHDLRKWIIQPKPHASNWDCLGILADNISKVKMRICVYYTVALQIEGSHPLGLWDTLNCMQSVPKPIALICWETLSPLSRVIYRWNAWSRNICQWPKSHKCKPCWVWCPEMDFSCTNDSR